DPSRVADRRARAHLGHVEAVRAGVRALLAGDDRARAPLAPAVLPARELPALPARRLPRLPRARRARPGPAARAGRAPLELRRGGRGSCGRLLARHLGRLTDAHRLAGAMAEGQTLRHGRRRRRRARDESDAPRWSTRTTSARP